MNTKHKLLTFLTTLALLMPISAVGQDKDVLIDKDFAITDGFLEGFGAKGHLKLTKNDFIITIPAQNLKAEGEDRRAGYTYIKKGSCTDITIQGKCKMIEKEWENSEGRIVRDTWFVIDGEYSVGPKEWRYEMNEDNMKKGFETGQIYRELEYKEKQTEILASKCSLIKKDEKFVYFEQGENGEVFHVKITIESLNCFVQDITNHYEEDGTLNEYYSDGGVWHDSGDINYGETFYMTFEGEGSCAGTMFAEGDSIDAPAIHEEDNEASEESGTMKFLIPIAVAVAVGGAVAGAAAGGVAAYRKRLRKKKERESQSQEDENSEEEQEEEKEPDDLRMDLYKDFGDTLVVGDAAQQVCACIVRMPKNGAEFTDEGLTRQIQITSGDDYLVVEDGEIVNGWKTSYVYAPEMDSPPEEGIVKFTIASAEGSYTNKIHFKIQPAGIIFDPRHDNVTIPARYDKVVKVPFLVMGMEVEEIQDLDVRITDMDGNPAKEYDVQVEYSLKKEDRPFHALITDLLRDEKKDIGIAGKHMNFLLKVEARNKEGFTIRGELPLFRFYMGLAFEVSSDVGCYLEKYDRVKHQKTTIVTVDDKKFVRAQNWCKVRFYDHHLEEGNHKIDITEPDPKELSLTLKASTDPSAQGIIDKLNLQVEGMKRYEGGYYYMLQCQSAALSVPNRFDADATLTWTHGGKTYAAAERRLHLLSQPRRCLGTPEEGQLAKEQDEKLERVLNHLDGHLRVTDPSGEMFPIALAIQTMKRGYKVEFGYDEDTIRKIVQSHQKVATYQMELDNYEASLLDKEPTFLENTYYLKKDLDQLPFYKRIGVGLITFGAIDYFAAIGAMQEKAMEVGEPGKDVSWYEVFYVGAESVTIDYLYEQGMRLGFGTLSYVGKAGQAVWDKGLLKAMKEGCSWDNFKSIGNELWDAVKGELNSVVNWKSAFRLWNDNPFKGAKAAEGAKESLKEADVLLKQGFKSSSLDKPLALARKEAKQKVKDLQKVIEAVKRYNDKSQTSEMYRLILEVQSDKFAMSYLNRLGDDFIPTRAYFNDALNSMYKSVDGNIKSYIARKYHISPDKIQMPTATSSNMLDLLMGKKVTFDRDVTYFWVNSKGECVYMGEEAVNLMYKRLFYDEYQKRIGAVLPDISKMSPEELLKYERLRDIEALKFGKEADQTVIQDVLKNKESYGVDLNKMVSKDLHHLPLDNPAKVADAIAHKGIERFKEFRSLMDAAGKAATEQEARQLSSKALGELVEGCRQEVKTFDIMLSRNAARFPINKKDMIPANLHKAIEVLRKLTTGEATLDQTEIALDLIGYTYDSLAASVGKLAIDIG